MTVRPYCDTTINHRDQMGVGNQVQGSGANFKKGRRADPGALGEMESLACQIGPKLKLCTRSGQGILEGDAAAGSAQELAHDLQLVNH